MLVYFACFHRFFCYFFLNDLLFVSGLIGRCKLFVGGVDSDWTTYDLEDFFKGAGKLRAVWVAKSPSGFGVKTHNISIS